MANKKVSTKKAPKAKNAAKTKAAPKKAKTPFYAQPTRLFSAVRNGGLPRGVYAKASADISGITVKVGNGGACVFEGKLEDFLAATLKVVGLKLKSDGAAIPDVASTPSAA